MDSTKLAAEALQAAHRGLDSAWARYKSASKSPFLTSDEQDVVAGLADALETHRLIARAVYKKVKARVDKAELQNPS